MNIPEYLASGILESYVVGAVSDQERREVNCLAAIYPEIQQELDLLSLSIENYALLHSVEPPIELKSRIMAQLSFEKTDDPIIRPMPVDYSTDRPTFKATWIVAASVGLLLLAFSFFLLSQLRTTQDTLAQLQSAKDSLQQEVGQLKNTQDYSNQALALFRQPGTRTLELRGNEKAPNGDMLVFWNAKTHQVAVEVRSLPPLRPDQQYQLWSLVGGKPVDAGVFNADGTNALLQQLNRPIDRADAFAVTIEKRGGSPTPTLSTLLAMSPVDA
ncbi:anti-sigma factor [Spirosoma oryzicola]|uniref:anti-sigma factor n=1 Tax=Spirosoma oryzicola TaxID=2898794 RepID=UPI001E48C053|nr:anti-sigma factor [Spirosoma oryzicola]UHG90442.1 anti-sigma factor [Spirosoma oryzicola]